LESLVDQLRTEVNPADEMRMRWISRRERLMRCRRSPLNGE
jgi:hypothetical protein